MAFLFIRLLPFLPYDMSPSRVAIQLTNEGFDGITVLSAAPSNIYCVFFVYLLLIVSLHT